MRTTFIVLLFILAACPRQQPTTEPTLAGKDTPPEKELPDCFKLYEDLFHARSVLSHGDSCLVEIVQPGVFHVSSGRIVLGDPVVLHDLEPIATRFPVGDFHPEIVRLRQPQGEWAVNALLRVRFSNAPPRQWKFAVSDPTVMDSADVHGESFLGFGVDAGTALLYDADHQEALMKMDFDALWADSVRVRPKSMAFSTGQGDGRYPAYVGFDSSGFPCQLIVDFLMVKCTCAPTPSTARRNDL